MEKRGVNVGTKRGEISQLSPHGSIPSISIPTRSASGGQYSTGYRESRFQNSGVYWDYMEVIPLSTHLIIRGV